MDPKSQRARSKSDWVNVAARDRKVPRSVDYENSPTAPIDSVLPPVDSSIIGLLPMGMKLGEGSESYAPLARAVIGGLLDSVVLTLFLVPIGYLLVSKVALRSADVPMRDNGGFMVDSEPKPRPDLTMT